MAPADPLFLMWCAANRTTVSGRTADPAQRIGAEKALRAVTIEAAYSIELEDEIGSVKVGKKADFTILDRDPLAIPTNGCETCEYSQRYSRVKCFYETTRRMEMPVRRPAEARRRRCLVTLCDRWSDKGASRSITIARARLGG